MKKRILAIALCIILAAGILPTPASAAEISEAEVYKTILSLKSKYPEGMPWSLANSYAWKGGIYFASRGCLGFGMMVSDAAFGSLPAREIKNNGSNINVYTLRAGDLLRLAGDSHTVVVLERHPDYITVVEGNYRGKVHWGRKISADAVRRAVHMTTRYPEKAEQAPTAPAPEPEYVSARVGDGEVKITDIVGHWAKNAAVFCIENGIMTAQKGEKYSSFSPSRAMSRAELAEALWRASGSPRVSEPVIFSDVPSNHPSYPAVCWAVKEKIVTGVSQELFAPDAVVTRQVLATMLFRMTKATSTDISALDEYSDKSEIAEFALQAVSWAQRRGLLSGSIQSNGKRVFLPYAEVTRAEAATVMERYRKK